MGLGYGDLLRPNRELTCASCGLPGAIAGYGGPPNVPACETCITRLPSAEFQRRIAEWKRRHESEQAGAGGKKP